jgi:hypothetical protein
MQERFDGIEQLWDDLIVALTIRDFLIYPSDISCSGPIAYWPLEEDYSEFFDFAEELGVKLIYMKKIDFTPEDPLELLFSLSSEDILDEEVASVEEYLDRLGIGLIPAAVEYIEFGKQYEGRLASIRAEWVYAGVVHAYWHIADWYTYMIEKASDLQDLIHHHLSNPLQ